MNARTGEDTRSAELPAWALIMRSPFKDYPPATSWLGGVPRTPKGFGWPCKSDGQPLHFIAQIDLSALQPEPTTGARPPGLPESGALLVFIGDCYYFQIIAADDMVGASPMEPPATTPTIYDLGYWGEGQTFNPMAVEPVAFIDKGDGRPAFLQDPFTDPAHWITTWGLATLEASIPIVSMENELRFAEEFFAAREKKKSAGEAIEETNISRANLEHYAMMLDGGREIVKVLEEWRNAAATKPPSGPVDKAALQQVFHLRTAFSKKMASRSPKYTLPGSAIEVWKKIEAEFPAMRKDNDFLSLPDAYRPFIEMNVIDWRGHRLFGLEPPFPNNSEDFRGQDPFISIASDPILGTESEHDYGFSIWCPRDDMAAGNFNNGQFIRHCAV